MVSCPWVEKRGFSVLRKVPQALLIFNRVNRNFLAFAGRHFSLCGFTQCDAESYFIKVMFSVTGLSPLSDE
jgi:hypothetical protein